MDLAIAAIFQNEAPYLEEWISFHLRQGVEHFYLFDHKSSDCPKRVLDPYIQKGIVSLTFWPLDYRTVYDWTLVQTLAYERALHFAKGKVKWLAFLDVDEFVFSVKKGSLVNALEDYVEFGGVAVNWQIFGTANVKKIPEGSRMIEWLDRKAPKDQEENRYVKSIVRPERVAGCESAHFMNYLPGFFQVTTGKTRFEGALSPSVEIDVLRINHYTLRDEYFLLTQKRERLKRWWGSDSDWKTKIETMNAVLDREILAK